MEETLASTCSCNEVQVTISEQPFIEFVCHCNDCKKFTHQDSATISFFSTPSVKITGHTKDYTITAKSGSFVTRKACANCNTPLINATSRFPQLIGVLSNTIKPPFVSNPASHVWVCQKSPNITIPSDVQQYEEGLV
ncbi:MAG: GFA family protein [Pseudomonadales bacterium]|nr:GFA family protein [Pseudomonadales bacterium]